MTSCLDVRQIPAGTGETHCPEAWVDLSPRVPLLMAIRDKIALAVREERRPIPTLSYPPATAAMERYRGGQAGEVGAALVVVGLSAERAAKESRIRDDMIRVAHRAGVSIGQLVEVSGLGRKTVTTIVSAIAGSQD